MKNVKLGDIVVIAVVLLIALALFAVRFFGRSDNNTLVVACGNNEVFYDLDEDRVFTVENNGHTLVIEIKEGRARVISSTCAGQDCVNMGEISQNNSSVACLPARVFVKIVSDSVEGGYDGVVG